tara:strand:- start:133 stop:1029 length:897 start_codon:yes stop_codon:yes gene_type:complete
LINCSLIGFGEWGKKIYKSIALHNNLKIKYVCKKNIDRINQLKLKTKIVSSFKEAINDQIEAVFIATPSETHFQIAKYALTHKKHIFIEKPVCFNNKEYQVLTNLAKENLLILHVNYIHLYNENFTSLINIYNQRKNNEKTFIKILLGNNMPIRKKTNVLMDWGPHIFSILNYILNSCCCDLISSKINSKTNNKSKCNIYLKFKYKNIYIKALFGNDFKKKNTYISISQNFNRYEYRDSYSKIIQNKKTKEINFQSKSPLENSISQFIRSFKNKNDKKEPLLDYITYQLEKTQYKLTK